MSSIYNNSLFHYFFSRLSRTHLFSHTSYKNHPILLITFVTIFLRLNIQPYTNLLILYLHTQKGKLTRKGKKKAASSGELLPSSTQKSRECNNPNTLKAFDLFSSFLEPITSDRWLKGSNHQKNLSCTNIFIWANFYLLQLKENKLSGKILTCQRRIYSMSFQIFSQW